MSDRLPADLSRENERLRGDLQTIARRFSHDLRTPLGSISTTAEVLKEILDQAAPAEAALATGVISSTDEIAGLIERVSFVLRASAVPAAPERVAMGEVVWGALQRLETRLRRRGAAVIQPAAWPEVRGVPAWLDMIWRTLLENSLAHGGPSPRIELGLTPGADETRFWVRDSGPGVPPAKQALLFQAFERMHELQAARGFGLPIVRRLVELQGGTCGFEMPAAGGAVFFFTLPAG
jgi:signal transduction histidine kinase